MGAPAWESDEHEKSLKAFTDAFDPAERNHEAYARRWREFDKVYHGTNHPPLVDDPDRSQNYRKVIYKIVETMLPRLCKRDPRFKFTPLQQAWAKNATISSKLISYQFGRDRFTLKQPALIKPAIVYGLTAGKVTWKNETETRKYRRNLTPEYVQGVLEQAITGQITEEQRDEMLQPHEMRKVEIWDQPTVLPVDIFDLFWDPSATSMEDCNFICHRSWLSPAQVKEKKALKDEDGNPVYGNLDHIGDAGSSGESRPGEGSAETEAKRQGRVEWIECWWRNRLLVIANRKVVVRDGDNPYDHRKLPFAVCFTTYEINKFVGLSEVWSIAQLQEAIWTMENQRIDAVTLSLDPILKVASSLKKKDFVTRRGARIEVEDMNDVEQLVIQAISAPAAWEEVRSYETAIEETSGITRTLQGEVSTDVATLGAIANKEANARMALKETFIQQFNAELAMLAHQLNQQYITTEKTIPVVGPMGEDWVKVTPEVIAGEYDITDASTTEAENKMELKESAEQLLAVLAPFLPDPTQPGSGFVAPPTDDAPFGRSLNLEELINMRIEAQGLDPDRLWQAVEPPPEPTMDPAAAGGAPGGALDPSAPPPMEGAGPVNPAAAPEGGVAGLGGPNLADLGIQPAP